MIDIGSCFGALRVRLLLGRMPGSKLPVYVVDAPYLYRRGGSPYQDSQGEEWPDNLQRFALLGWVAAHLAAGDADPSWAPDIVHAHDWHAAMACAYMAEHPATQRGHRLHGAQPGLPGPVPACTTGRCSAWPSRLMSPAGLEFHGQLSFMKAGLKFADRITTVSPTYAREIATHEFGCGLDGVIRGRGADVARHPQRHRHRRLEPGRRPRHRRALRRRTPGRQARLQGGAAGRAGPGRRPSMRCCSTWSAGSPSQKGLDLVLAALPDLVRSGVQFAVQGTGEPALEAAFRMAAAGAPGPRRACTSATTRRARTGSMAGADAIAGAFALRALRADAAVRPALRHAAAGAARRRPGRHGGRSALQAATGFVFDAATPAALERCALRALAVMRQPAQWRTLMQRAMAQTLVLGRACAGVPGALRGGARAAAHRLKRSQGFFFPADAAGFSAPGLGASPSTVFRGHTENAGHFLQPATMAMGQTVMVRSSSPTGAGGAYAPLCGGRPASGPGRRWRRGRDSNPRGAINPHTLSRRAT